MTMDKYLMVDATMNTTTKSFFMMQQKQQEVEILASAATAQFTILQIITKRQMMHYCVQELDKHKDSLYTKQLAVVVVVAVESNVANSIKWRMGKGNI